MGASAPFSYLVCIYED